MATFRNKFSRVAATAAICTFTFTAAVAATAMAARALSRDELAQERHNVEQWKAERLTSLTSDTGWLTLSGLFWLKPGNNTFGSDKTNALHLDNKALPRIAGTFVVTGNQVRFVAHQGAGITHADKPVTDIELVSDATDDPTLLSSGSLSFYLIERAGQLGIRVRDSDNPHRKNFRGLSYYPVDDSWVVDARFEPYAPHRKIPIVNIIGMQEDMDAPGALVFTHAGKQYRIDALLENPTDKELFLMFADGTSGKQTYGAGRFMYVPLPQDGVVRLNFNEAYNPPCAFSTFATCPLPPPQNRLTTLSVEAGEKTYVGAGEP